MMGPPLGKCDKISVDRGSVIQMGQGDWAISGRFLPKAGAGRSAHTGPLQLSDLIKWFGEMPERPAAGAVKVRVDQRRGTATASKKMFTDRRPNPSGPGGASVWPEWGVGGGGVVPRE